MYASSLGIIQTLRNAVLGENSPPPSPLSRSVTLVICPLLLLRNEIFDTLPPPSTEVYEEMHNSDNSDVIWLSKTEHIYPFKRAA